MNLDKLIELALEEDIFQGDVTTDNLGISDKEAIAVLVAKENGVLAGIKVAKKVFQQVDNKTKFTTNHSDGYLLKKGDIIANIEGFASSILKAERIALNFMQRMSGIATTTRFYIEKISHTSCKLLDTRKTTPLLRNLEKYSVKVGGGFNHRFGLYDMIMLKENHIRVAGSISKAVAQVKSNTNSYKIEVEVTNLQELEEAVNCNIDRVMLDNMSLADIKKAVEKFSDIVELEASGNVTQKTIKKIAETGVHYISSGAITHSYKSLDISLLFKEKV
ncbi:MAG: carboxylating nicotinate-nucleotide diphosphorylase [Candidatus Cloacimonetes bacterium]|nr:carboxylating nicotinate-nucleotide diphosphorylase [Candidatus Cloacimonadota bacterium]